MPQLVQFPYLPSIDAHIAVDRLIELCRGVPEAGESYRELRSRMRDLDMWDKERVIGFQSFFRLEGGARYARSDLLSTVAADDDGTSRAALADRLWQANPVLFKTVVERLGERVSPPGELYSFLDSFAYRGLPIPRQELLSWVQLMKGLDIIKRIGIALGVGERADSFVDRARKLEFDEYLEEDAPEPSLARAEFSLSTAISAAEPAAVADVSAKEPGAPTHAAPVAATAAVRNAASADSSTDAAAKLGSPLGKNPSVSVASFCDPGLFSEEIRDDTSMRLVGWWDGYVDSEPGFTAELFGIDSETWMAGSEESAYRLAVAAAFVFRLGGSVEHVRDAFALLDRARVLDDLYYGTAPDELPEGVDSRALMLASLVARRCAEVPDLATTLEKQKSAADAFGVLDSALGRGLLELELFWLMRALAEVGALRFDDMDNYTALPTRAVRDTLFRLGFLDTPYARGLPALSVAAAAAHRATGGPAADRLLTTFATAAQCSYGCAQRRRCDFACRERLE